MKKMMLVALLSGGLLFAGCDEKKGGGAAGGGEKGGEKGGAEKKGGGGGGEIGVAECDDYIKKMEACLGKMPAEAKAAMEQGFKQSREAWKQAASTPAGKEGLKTACKAASDALANNPACK